MPASGHASWNEENVGVACQEVFGLSVDLLQLEEEELLRRARIHLNDNTDGEFIAFTAEPNHSNALGGRPTFRETAAKRVMVAATRSCSHLTSLAVTGVLHQTGVERYWTFVL